MQSTMNFDNGEYQITREIEERLLSCPFVLMFSKEEN